MFFQHGTSASSESGLIFFLQEKQLDNLTPEAKRFLDRLITLGKRNGLHLSKDIQEVIQTLEFHTHKGKDSWVVL